MWIANLKTRLVIAILLVVPAVTTSASSVVGWGGRVVNTEWAGKNFVGIVAAGGHSLALRSDGTIVGWGVNTHGQATPPDANDYVAVAAGSHYSLALKTVGPAMIEVSLKFTPEALNPGSKGKWVKAHLVLPEGFVVEDVDTDTPAEIEQLGIQSEYMNVFVNEEGLVEIEAAFERGRFCSNVLDEKTITIMGLVSGWSGRCFYGTDAIKIVNSTLKKLGRLASHWLEADCGKPDWCGGLDVDQDSIVNFVDFALFDGCCVETITE